MIENKKSRENAKEGVHRSRAVYFYEVADLDRPCIYEVEVGKQWGADAVRNVSGTDR